MPDPKAGRQAMAVRSLPIAHVGGLLTVERNRRGLNQREFSRLLALPPADINRYESGIRRPSVRRILHMARVLKLDRWQTDLWLAAGGKRNWVTSENWQRMVALWAGWLAALPSVERAELLVADQQASPGRPWPGNRAKIPASWIDGQAPSGYTPNRDVPQREE